MAYTLASIRNQILVKLNDLDQTNFTDTELLPHAISAGNELQNELEKAGILVLEKKSAAITVPINTLSLGTASPSSLIPTDLLEPQRISERLSGSTDLYLPMTRREWEPEILPTDSLRYWTWREQDIFFVGATTARQIKINYLKKLIVIADWTTSITVNNSEEFMVNRIAALAAEFSGENKTRADSLNLVAIRELDTLTAIGVKSKQGARTRRRPFVLVGRRRWL